MVSYSIHVIAEYNLSGSKIICRQIFVLRLNIRIGRHPQEAELLWVIYLNAFMLLKLLKFTYLTRISTGVAMYAASFIHELFKVILHVMYVFALCPSNFYDSENVKTLAKKCNRRICISNTPLSGPFFSGVYHPKTFQMKKSVWSYHTGTPEKKSTGYMFIQSNRVLECLKCKYADCIFYSKMR